MTFAISFIDDAIYDRAKGSISLGNAVETFYSDLSDYSCDDYKAQWTKAINLALNERRTTAIFKSIELAENGIGHLWLYPIVPSEHAGDTSEKQALLEGFPQDASDGVYLTERFMNVTIRPENFNERHFLQYEDGTVGEELALYYLNLSSPESFFGYLHDNVSHISHWYFSNSDLKHYLSRTA